MGATEPVEMLECDHCGDMFDEEDGYDEDFCSETCWDRYHHYRQCCCCDEEMHEDNLTYNESHDGYQCNDCYEGDTTGVYRDYSTSMHRAYTGASEGTIITSPRLFSAEIEAQGPDGSALRSLSEKLDDAFGIADDGSINGRYTVEVQTPKLQGANGQKAVEDVCKVMNDLGYTTDRSCGLHIHLDGKGLDKFSPLKYLMAAYMVYEDVLMSFLPPSRRSNRYCELIRNDFHLDEIAAARSVIDLEKIWYREDDNDRRDDRKHNKYDNSRYHGLNLHPLFAEGHLEIRYHSGTVSARKILEWANLHQRIADWAVMMGSKVVGDFDYRTALSMTSVEEKAESLYNMLDLSKSSRVYFKGRQKTFNSVLQDRDEDKAKELCAA